MSPAEFHWAPRTPGDPEQTFSADVYHLEGELFGDPDFCTFRVRAGTDYVLPSPGQTTLSELPSGHFTVDSFFDVNYQIEFEGCPGSVLDGYSGTTTDTVRIQLQVTEWSELLYPPTHPMDGQSIDLAFAIRGEERCTAGSDTDGDSWYDEIEWAIGTQCLDDCPDDPTDDALPPDFTMDKTVNILDVLMYKPKLGGPYDPRYDLNVDSTVNILDVLMFKPELPKPWPCT
ncbi:MAG: hypothetical protein GTO22_13060 [Gemmatimonadales bacterium]|nr:hypothetical protein [Gemmatimonadales bacterium]